MWLSWPTLFLCCAVLAGPTTPPRVNDSIVPQALPDWLPFKRFVWLVQVGKREAQSPEPTAHRDVIWLTFDEPSGDVFFPNSTYSQGRNRLLDEAIRRAIRMPDGGYLYYIFMDGDVKLETRKARLHYRPDLPADPFDCFEAFLLDWEPAVGSVAYKWTAGELRGVSVFHNNDALLQAQHRETLSFGLPCMDLDCHSWYYQQHVMNNINAVLYNTRRVQLNAVVAMNQEHNHKMSYLRTTKWKAAQCFFRNALKLNSSLRAASVQHPHPYHTTGRGRSRGNVSYIVPLDFIRDHFHTAHPLVVRSLQFRARADVQLLLQHAAAVQHRRPFSPDPRGCDPQSKDTTRRCIHRSGSCLPTALLECPRK